MEKSFQSSLFEDPEYQVYIVTDYQVWPVIFPIYADDEQWGEGDPPPSPSNHPPPRGREAGLKA